MGGDEDSEDDEEEDVEEDVGEEGEDIGEVDVEGESVPLNADELDKLASSSSRLPDNNQG